VISPVKDEAEHFARTADSMVAQSHRPIRWVVVDDGSSDQTAAIASRYAREHDWISVMSSGRSGERERGGPVVGAFNAGLAVLDGIPDFVVKMDGDIFLPAHYFAWVAETFSRVPTAGIVGGTTRLFDGERWVPDTTSRHNVSGVAKAYRRECFEAIGGLRVSMGWDGIDEYGARARGWQVHVLSELTILHYKARGSAQPWYRARAEEGRGASYMDYWLPFLLVRIAYLMARERPPVLGGLVLAASFLSARLKGAPKVDDPDARRLLRSEQRARLLGILSLRGPDAPLPEVAGGGPAFWAAAAREPARARASSQPRSAAMPTAATDSTAAEPDGVELAPELPNSSRS
jgi:biofilm PGA synthesis N-glycosyltransferase PgaC